jgi:hypothetical protein
LSFEIRLFDDKEVIINMNIDEDEKLKAKIVHELQRINATVQQLLKIIQKFD